MTVVVVLILHLLTGGVADGSQDVRKLIDDYYASIPSIAPDALYAHQEAREPLLAHGREAILVLVDDLHASGVTESNRVKAVFALGAFSEEGTMVCSGNVIRALIEVLEEDSDAATWAYVLLDELTSMGFGKDVRRWSLWWSSEGSRDYDICPSD